MPDPEGRMTYQRTADAHGRTEPDPSAGHPRHERDA